MLKKLSLVFFAALLFAIVFSVTAYAVPDDFTMIVEKANNAIDQEIDKAVSEADRMYAKYMANVAKVSWLLEYDCISQCTADKRLLMFRAQFDRDIEVIAFRLIRRTERIANYLVSEGKKRGIVVQKEYIEVVLAGKTYLVDPLRIVGN